MPAKKKSAAQLPPQAAALLEAHVRFETARLQEAGVRDAVGREIEAVFEWLSTVTLEELVPPQQTARAAAGVLAGATITDELIGLVVDVLLVSRKALWDSDLQLSSFAGREDLEPVIDVVADLEDLRNAMIGAITASTAYHHLVAHVLYHGIKAYLLTENLFARKMPGAAALVKLGQKGLNTAAPGLEDAVDRQLSAFVQANIGETLRDSRRFLEHNLDGDMLRTVVDQAWQAMAEQSLRGVIDTVEEADIETLTVTLGPLVRKALSGGRLTPVVEQLVQDALTEYGPCQVAAMLTDFGVTPQGVTATAVQALEPVLGTAHETGFLQQRIRARLEPFYRSPEFTRALADSGQDEGE